MSFFQIAFMKLLANVTIRQIIAIMETPKISVICSKMIIGVIMKDGYLFLPTVKLDCALELFVYLQNWTGLDGAFVKTCRLNLKSHLERLLWYPHSNRFDRAGSKLPFEWSIACVFTSGVREKVKFVNVKIWNWMIKGTYSKSRIDLS